MGFGDEHVKRAMAKQALLRLTVESLARTYKRAEKEVGDAKHLGQVLAPVEFLHSVADAICVMEPDEFSEAVVQDALASVADAYDQVLADQPVGYQRLLIQPWRDGIRIQ